jgi:NADH-quinone oxidoreductase subunit E
MAHLSVESRQKAEASVACYPKARSALIPLCHIAQAQDGWLTPEAIEDIAALVGCSPAEVRGTATFYDMLHTEPVGRHVFSVCTNIACMLAGAYELLEYAEGSLGISVGQTTADGEFTLEEAECLAACDIAPCVQVNHRFFGPVDAAGFDELCADLRSGNLAEDVPRHGVLSRVERNVGLVARSKPAAGASQAPAPPALATPPGESEG